MHLPLQSLPSVLCARKHPSITPESLSTVKYQKTNPVTIWRKAAWRSLTPLTTLTSARQARGQGGAARVEGKPHPKRVATGQKHRQTQAAGNQLPR